MDPDFFDGMVRAVVAPAQVCWKLFKAMEGVRRYLRSGNRPEVYERLTREQAEADAYSDNGGLGRTPPQVARVVRKGDR